MVDKRKKATKVKCKRGHERDESVNIPGIYSFLDKEFEFCWS